jgi:hypothetical protein
MQYQGKLYGKIGNKYFDTGVTSNDIDKLNQENQEMLEALKKVTLTYPDKIHKTEAGDLHDIDFNFFNTIKKDFKKFNPEQGIILNDFFEINNTFKNAKIFFIKDFLEKNNIKVDYEKTIRGNTEHHKIYYQCSSEMYEKLYIAYFKSLVNSPFALKGIVK